MTFDFDRNFTGKAAIAAVQYGRQGEYWLKKFSGELQKTAFPYDFNIKLHPGHQSKHNIGFELSVPYVSKLIELSKGLDYRLYIILTASLVVLLHKYTGNKDIIIGSPIFKQDKEGNFINTMLPLRNQIDGEMTFKELLLDQVRPTIIEANEHQNYPIETLLFQLNMTVTREEFPLFDVVILLENIHEKKYIHSVHPNVIFSFSLNSREGENKIQVEYNTARYHRETIQQIIRHFNYLMEQVVFNVNIPLNQVEILSKKEKRQLVLEFNDTKTEYPAGKTIDDLFLEQVSRGPNSIAVTYEGQHLTYQELNVQSEGLACYLHMRGVKLEEPVAIMVENSHNVVVAVLGILKAGGIYLPLSADYPEERRKYLIRDCNARILLTNFADSCDYNYILTVIDIDDSDIYKSTDDRHGYCCHSSDNLAYIMYTSGSTGVPKGVMVGHRNVVRLVKNTNYIEFREGNSILLTGVLEFDASTFEIWGAILNGLSLHLMSKYSILSHDKLKQTVVRSGINTMWMTSPLFNQMLDMDSEIFSGLKYLLVGGDILSPPHINRVKKRFPGLKVINGYGPTENTTFSTTYLVDKEYYECIPIGKPIANSTAYILDQLFRLVPIGVSGELFVGGDGLSRGYLNNPELTAEKFDHDLWDYQDYHDKEAHELHELTPTNKKFLRGGEKKEAEKLGRWEDGKLRNELRSISRPHPGTKENQHHRFAQHIGSPRRGAPARRRQKIYKTGDLARWLPDGNIEFQGRIDRQVKIRGYRIEPGEIETLLMQVAFIEKAVITDRENSDGEKYLCAYVVAAREKKHKLDTMELKKMLSRQLPDYMVPGFLWQLDEIPLTPNGKIDRKALSRLEIEADQRYIAPRNYMESKMAGIFSEVLKIDKEVMGIDSNFFDLGGHSLRAMILISKLNKVLNVKIPLAELFKKPTIRQLTEYIGELKEDPYTSIGAAEKKEYYVLSSAQKRLYVLQQMDLKSTAYNIPQVLVLEGKLNQKALENTFRQLIQRHESFRTSIEIIKGEPGQRIHPQVEFTLETREFEQGMARLTADYLMGYARVFDLSCPPLLRVGLIKEEDRKHILMVDMHHIITDGTSMDLFVKESMALYAGKKLLPLRYQYKDYAEWQTSDQQKRVFKEQEEYWVRQFGDGVPVLNLSLDFPRPNLQSFEGETLFFQLSIETTRALNQLALYTGVTLYMVTLAIYNVLLSKLSGQEDIIVGTPSAARRHVDLERIIGMFVNTLAMRNYPAGNKKFTDFLKELKKRTLEAFENQEYQFEDLVERVSANRDISRNPIFDVLFGLQNMEGQTSEIPVVDISQLKIRPYEGEHRTAKFDLNLTCIETREKLLCSLEYCTKLFKKNTIERFIIYFQQILSAVLENPKQNISQIEIITAEEKRQVLYEFNDTMAAYDREKTLHQLFAQQVERTPDNIALTRPLAKKYKSYMTYMTYISYRELNQKAHQLALILNEKGVRPDTIVGIMAERSLEMIIGILGILKAGGAYLPIDPDYPAQRIKYILGDSKAKILVKNSNDISESFIKKKIEVIHINEVINNMCPKGASFHLHLPPAPATSLAYVIYTSGTTGKPRGVLIQQRNVVQLMVNNQCPFDFSSRDVWTLFHSFCFDFSVWEIFGALLYGARLVIISKMTAMDTEHYLEILKSQQVTILNQTPSAFYHLMNLELEKSGKELNIRCLIFGGEALNPQRLKEWKSRYPESKLINMYGITETTVHVTFKEIGPVEMESVTSNIGKGIPTLSVYIMDKYLGVLPVGISGEVCVSGEGVGRGYLNQPELTKEKFVENPYEPGKLLYRSGDLARWSSIGELEYKGRIDQQVKIRGYRIEAGEIENRLLTNDSIKEAVVLVKNDETADKYLCAYIVSDREQLVSELREFLLRYLPDYMVPSYFMRVEKIPLTASGKIDRKALPEPGIEIDTSYIGPRNRIERKLVRIWSDLLSLEKEKISIDANFFTLGGHSLKATVMIVRIHKELNVKVTLADIFRSPTIRNLSSTIKESVKEAYISIEPVEKKEYYDLSSAQKRLYVLQRMELNGTPYNIPLTLTLEGKLDKNRLEGTFRELIERHESLRTSFHMIDEKPVQRIHEKVKFKIEYHDISLISSFILPFDLSQAPLLRVGLIKEQEQKHILMIDMHHIITDGVSMDLFVRETMALYRGEKLPSLRLQYRDYSGWQISARQKKAIKEQEEYWLSQFVDEVPVLDLPFDYPRPVIKSFEGAVLSFEVPGELTRSINRMALDSGATLYMVLLAIYNILLSKISGQKDIVVGTPIAARRHADLETIIGMFVNTLALRNYPGSQKTALEFLEEIKESTLQAFENQEYQFEDLVEQVSVNRDTSRNPLFDTMFALGNTEAQANEIPMADIPQLSIKPYETEYRTAKFDLNLTCIETREKLLCSLEYCTKLFKKETIARFIIYFQQILSTVLKDSNEKISQIEIITTEEKRRILYDFNDTVATYPENKALHQLFAEQVEQTPDNIAVVGPLGKKHRTYMIYMTYISYRELNNKSNQLAYYLIENGVRPDTIVGIMVERSLHMMIGIFGILKAGGAYMPIDPDYPQERIDYMLKDSGTKILLTGQEIAGLYSPQALYLSEGHHSIFPTSQLPNFPALHSSRLAYVIYTSGSTGRSKGVLIQHGSLVNRLNWMQKTYPLDTYDILLQKTTYTFDVSIWEILWWSFTGARLCLLQPGGERDPAAIIETIEKNRVTVIHFVPSMLSVFLEYLQTSGQVRRLSCLKQVIVSGEALTVSHVNRFNEIFSETKTAQPKLDNLYGPTEATIDVSYFACPREQREKIEKIPIGKPIDNIQLYVMAQGFQLLPVGIPGELCIAGHGLARGYLNRPELTAGKFDQDLWDLWDYQDKVNKSFSGGPGGRFFKKAPLAVGGKLYKTGDLARWLSDGNIEFLGRIDSQVKIRGYRVELGEIENRLNRHQAVKESVVMHRETLDSAPYLCAYIVSQPDLAPDRSLALEQELKEYLSFSLPGYMIPAFFVHLERIPLTPNGKIDRKQLPEPDITPGENYIAPANVLEETLVDIWSQVLGIERDRISVNASFFQLGGHSLKASILTAGIYKKLEVNLPLLEIFRNPTIRKIAGILQRAEKTTFMDMEKVEKREYYPLSINQERIFVLHQLYPEGASYNLPGTFVIHHEVKEETIKGILHQIIRRHESLRTGFKMINDEPVQFINDIIAYELEVPFTFIELSELEESEKQQERDRVYLSLATTPFNLGQVPLLRSVLLKYQTGHYEMMYNMHHIITDGWSMEILRHEFIHLYEARQQGSNLEMVPLAFQYKDFTAWNKRQLKGQEGGKSREYWKKQLEKGISSFSIPGDFAGKANNYKGAAYTCMLPQEIEKQIEKLAAVHHTSVFMVLFTLYLLLLYRFTRQRDIACSIIEAGRQHPSLHNIIGFFVNAVIFNTAIDNQENFRDILQRVHREVMLLFQHQWYPLEQVCRDMKISYPEVPLSFNMLNQQEVTRDVEIESKGLGEHKDSQDVKFELEPYITRYKNGILMHWVYKKNLYRPSFIEYMAAEYIKLVDFFTHNPHRCFADYQGMDRKAISLEKIPAAPRSEYTGTNIVQEFENQVRKSPDRVAVKSGEEAITYRELNGYAHRVARQIEFLLVESPGDIKPGGREAIKSFVGVQGAVFQKSPLAAGGKNEHKIIGLLLDPGIDMAAGIMGVLETGSAYVPLSPGYPTKRLSYILDHSQACLLISDQANKSRARQLAAENNIPYLELSGIEEGAAGGGPGIEFSSINQKFCGVQGQFFKRAPGRRRQEDEFPAVTGSTLAYLLYTSGSTGAPKGVMQNHQNILYFIKNWTQWFSLSGTDRLTLLSSFCHDASIPDIFGALLNGATLYPFDIKKREDSMDLAQFLVKERITHWHSVASLFGNFANSLKPGIKFPGLRYVILGGEAVREHDIHGFKDLFPGTGLAVVYGQTESTVNALWFFRQSRTYSINRPQLGEALEETRTFVVDEADRQVQPYETGEIVVASPYISPGYWRDDALTQKSFKQDPNIGKFYYTGDLGRYLPDGTIEFMGRKDWQVKIRGYRIEPGEIESRLLKHPDIKEAVVTARESQTGGTGDRYLCAYVVSRKDMMPAAAQSGLREYLSGYLPAYMIPGVFQQLEKIPLTATGKLDRKALPEPRLSGETGTLAPAPGTDIEKKVAQAWKEVLNVDRAGIMDSFFSIGGNSVNILRVNACLRREFNREIPLVKMFEHPTISALARYLEQLEIGDDGETRDKQEMEIFDRRREQSLNILEQTIGIIKSNDEKK